MYPLYQKSTASSNTFWLHQHWVRIAQFQPYSLQFTFHTRLDSSPNAKHGAAASGASCSREHMESSVEVPQVVAGKQQLGQVKVQEPQLDILSCSY